MLLDFDSLVKKYNLNIKGVIHIGAHYGEEHKKYKKYNIENIIYFEADEKTFQVLRNNIKDDSILYNYALGNESNKIIDFNVASNNGASSSILKPNKHLTRHPTVKFNEKSKVKLMKLDDFEINKDKYNFINIDVQGYELEVFKGSKETLKSIDYIMSEINNDDVYSGCALVDEVDKFLKEYNFIRVETSWAGKIWGDGFYIKKNK